MSDECNILDPDAGQAVVQIARQGLELFVRDNMYFQPEPAELPQALQEKGASFVTLTNEGRLRGCIGHTQGQDPLAEDVARNAASASRDFRFAPVNSDELADIRLEVTILTPFSQVSYDDFDDLLAKLRPGVDGVMLSRGPKRALLLPQVWRRLLDPTQFIEAIARKAGIAGQELREIPPSVVVHTFQAQHFAEPGYREPGS
jgi:AmmeMemoRadiSam system protein A